LDNPLHVILNNSKLAYRIYVILIANKELIQKQKNSLSKFIQTFNVVMLFLKHPKTVTILDIMNSYASYLKQLFQDWILSPCEIYSELVQRAQLGPTK
jgi:hypothetical protein